MISERFDTAANANHRVTTTARQLVLGEVVGMFALVLLAVVVTAAVAWFAAEQIGVDQTAVSAAVAVLVAIAGTITAARRLAGRLTPLIAHPVDLLLSHLIMQGEDVACEVAFLQPKSLSLTAAKHDLETIERRMANVAQRSQAMIIELERTREDANLQNLAKSQFLANMSHELRTPLNAVLGYAMLLAEDANDAGNESAVADLGRIQQAGRQLLQLINEILDLSKIEAGKSTVERSVIDVNALVRSAVEGFESDKGRNGNRFEMTVARDVGIMVGDQSKIKQCLTNLLGNAFKFTTDGDVSLNVDLVERGDRAEVVFRIVDTGIGIGPEQHERLFEPFYQGDASATRKFGGTGLGLAITRRLARLMGGDVTIETTGEIGSTFLLTLPLNSAARESEVNAFASEDTAVATDTVVAASGNDRTALIIDDSESALDLMRRWLTRLDYDVLTATDGASGLALARSAKPDLIILDVLLPDRSGYDILTEFRADETLSETPIILVTVDDDRARGLEAGATDYIRKPVVEKQLREMLEVYRDKASGEILVIEDDDDAAELVRRCVQQVGFSCRRAKDGIEGLTMARDRTPIAIVLDLTMPNLDGFQVIEALTSEESLRDIPVIVLSACEISFDDHRRIIESGYLFCAKGTSSPREIAQHLKEMVS
jgi:signal transduction histidine kinase/DNA-binding response OmpR family regulator